MTIKASEILDYAGGLIETRGLHKGSLMSDNELLLTDPECRFCAVGAIEYGHQILAADRFSININLAAEGEAKAALHQVLRAAGAGRSIVSWNDDDARTQDEVVAAFRKAAEVARESEAA